MEITGKSCCDHAERPLPRIAIVCWHVDPRRAVRLSFMKGGARLILPGLPSRSGSARRWQQGDALRPWRRCRWQPHPAQPPASSTTFEIPADRRAQGQKTKLSRPGEPWSVLAIDDRTMTRLVLQLGEA